MTAGAPTLKTFITTDATEEGDRGDLAHLDSRLICNRGDRGLCKTQ